MACAMAKDGFPDQAMASLQGYPICPEAFPTLVKHVASGPRGLAWCEEELSKLEKAGKSWTRHYNAILGQIEKSGDAQRGRRLLARMKEAGVQPDEVTYLILINGYGRRGELARCKEMFEEMKERGVRVKATVFNSLMDAWGSGGDVEGAMRWMKVMEGMNVVPDVSTYTILIENCRRSGRTAECDLLFKVIFPLLFLSLHLFIVTNLLY